MPDIGIMLTFRLKLVAPWEKSIKRHTEEQLQTLKTKKKKDTHTTPHTPPSSPPYPGELFVFQFHLYQHLAGFQREQGFYEDNSYMKEGKAALPCAVSSPGHRMEKTLTCYPPCLLLLPKPTVRQQVDPVALQLLRSDVVIYSVRSSATLLALALSSSATPFISCKSSSPVPWHFVTPPALSGSLHSLPITEFRLQYTIRGNSLAQRNLFRVSQCYTYHRYAYYARKRHWG